MSMSEQLEFLCDILIWQNNAIRKSISKGKFNELELYKYFKETAREIKLFKKTLSHDSLPFEPHESLPVESKEANYLVKSREEPHDSLPVEPKNEQQEQYQD